MTGPDTLKHHPLDEVESKINIRPSFLTCTLCSRSYSAFLFTLSPLLFVIEVVRDTTVMPTNIRHDGRVCYR